MSGIQFINSKNCRFLFFHPLHLLSPQSKTAAASPRQHLYGLLRRHSTSTGGGSSLPAPAHNPAAAASAPQGAKFQLTSGLAVAPLPVTRQSDLLRAKQLPGLSSAPALCQHLLWLSAPLRLQLALVPYGGVSAGGTGPGTSGSQSVPLPSALSSSLRARGTAAPRQMVCRNQGSRVSWAPQDPASGCREQVRASPIRSTCCPFPVCRHSRARGLAALQLGFLPSPADKCRSGIRNLPSCDFSERLLPLARVSVMSWFPRGFALAAR